MCGDSAFRQHGASASVVVRNANIGRVSVFPSKNDSPLVVDPNAAEPLQRSFQMFEAIARWNLKIFCRLGRVQHVKLPKGDADYVGRKATYPCPAPPVGQILSCGIP